jgi:lipopolysaccharide transport system ATP-binding protein
MLKVLSRITSPTCGEAFVRGRVGSLLEVGTGFHPELSGRENIYLNGTLVGMRRSEIDRRFEEIVAFADVGRFLDTPVKRYSSGMYIRLAFAVAAHLDAEILLIDEVLAVGDQAFQRKCLGKMGEVSRSGRTVLFVSHNMAAVRSLCDRCILLEKGRVRLDTDSASVIGAYLQRDTLAQSAVRFAAGEGPGDEHLRLISMELQQDGAAPGAQVRSSLPLEIVMRFSVERPSPKLQVGFELLSGDGTQVLQSFHTDESGERALPRGAHELRCELQPGLLNEGAFIIYPAAALYYESWILRRPHGAELRFDVMLDHPQSDMWYAAREGVLAPALTWEGSVLAEVPPGAPSQPTEAVK